MLSRTVLHCRGPLGRSWRASGVVGVETAALPIPCSSTCGDSNRRQPAVTLLAPIARPRRWLASTRSSAGASLSTGCATCARAAVLAAQPQIAARLLGVSRGVVRVLDAVHPRCVALVHTLFGSVLRCALLRCAKHEQAIAVPRVKMNTYDTRVIQYSSILESLIAV